MSRFESRKPKWKGSDMNDSVSRGVAALLGVSTFEATDRISAKQAEMLLRLIATHTDRFDLMVTLVEAADKANELAGGTIKADRYEKNLIAYVAELYRNRPEAVAAYLRENPEPRFAPDPRDIP